jgi:Zn-dependent alcohol dehydrogenase
MAATGTLSDGTSRLSLEGETIHHFNAVSSFAGHAVVPEPWTSRSAGTSRWTAPP